MEHEMSFIFNLFLVTHLANANKGEAKCYQNRYNRKYSKYTVFL